MSNRTAHLLKILMTLFIIIYCAGCKKLVEISNPVDTITTSETFSTETNATSAVMGIYNNLSYGYNGIGTFSFGNGLTTCSAAQSADELYFFDGSNTDIIQFQTNELQPANGTLTSLIWKAAYYQIYMCNAAIEGIASSNTLSKVVKDQLTGEAKFLRAFIHFYLVNLFGDVPLITITTWADNVTVSRTPVQKVYTQIVADLIDAQGLLPKDYSISGDKRIRANAWAATAMLARVYLCLGDWKNAESAAGKIIDSSGLFALEPDLNAVFLNTSTEAILQWQISDRFYPFATLEGNQIIPYDPTSYPNYYITEHLQKAFEPNDKRKVNWTSSTNYAGVTYYYPSKYKVRQGESGNIKEYYMVLRLAEQFLIRAEAKAHLNNDLSGAVRDLNAIRARAGLPDLVSSLSQNQLLDAIMQERRVELFVEWGHRWIDLKRTGKADAVLGAVKPSWQPTDKLYPIPQSELQWDPNLVQNPGY